MVEGSVTGHHHVVAVTLLLLLKQEQDSGRMWLPNASLVSGPSDHARQGSSLTKHPELVGAQERVEPVPSGRGEDQNADFFLSLSHGKGRNSSLLQE